MNIDYIGDIALRCIDRFCDYATCTDNLPWFTPILDEDYVARMRMFQDAFKKNIKSRDVHGLLGEMRGSLANGHLFASAHSEVDQPHETGLDRGKFMMEPMIELNYVLCLGFADCSCLMNGDATIIDQTKSPREHFDGLGIIHLLSKYPVLSDFVDAHMKECVSALHSEIAFGCDMRRPLFGEAVFWYLTYPTRRGPLSLETYEMFGHRVPDGEYYGLKEIVERNMRHEEFGNALEGFDEEPVYDDPSASDEETNRLIDQTLHEMDLSIETEKDIFDSAV